MRNKCIMVIAALTLQIFLFSSAFGEVEWKEPKFSGKAFDCSIAGIWEVPDPGFGLAIVTPLNPTGKSFSFTFDSPPPPMPIFAGYKFSSAAHGVIYKVGENLYDFTLRRYVILADGLTVLKMRVRGLTKFLDCNTRVCSYCSAFFNVDGEPVNANGVVVSDPDDGLCVSKRVKLLRVLPEAPCCDALPDFLD